MRRLSAFIYANEINFYTHLLKEVIIFDFLSLSLYKTSHYRDQMKPIFYRTANMLSKKCISKQNIISFIGTHPRLITLLAAIGISFTFASVGRFFLNEAFAVSSSSLAETAIDHITKVSVDSVPGESHNTIPNLSCQACADESMPEPFPEEKFPFDKFPADKFPKKIG
jgi:hypothetical protein